MQGKLRDEWLAKIDSAIFCAWAFWTPRTSWRIESLIDTIERSFYRKIPLNSQEPEREKTDLHPPEKDLGIETHISDHSYQPHPITPGRPESTDQVPPLIPREQQHHYHNHREMFGHPIGGLTFILHWGCAVLTVAATVLFGIWAPLSYQETKEANIGNDEMQRALILSAESANEIATSALLAASRQLQFATAQASAISNLQEQLAAMGEVALLQFCNAQTSGALAITTAVHRADLGCLLAPFLGSFSEVQLL
ncbi:predicted protein [Histoplasma mississippiense (nom. inval.)]|uniref:predicted protein n=1 Tax=Ajellomyces capsulatus (strain NAm1 / WU24) TaxID=2059318 RepID=UPI000157BC90|nr:predicted protein [Histoplasma mississippiense (nom. inval.)]EDN05997.1 predicted protein [Histoplasma mississippiense (nom. inval.)]